MAKREVDTDPASGKPKRTQKRSQQTRGAIIAAASAIFQKKGVGNTTVTDITEAADVGYGTFYHHFHSLDDVVAAVAEATMRHMVSIAASVLPEDLRFEYGPAICARVFIRYLSKDPAVRCLLERPYVFVDEWHKAITPFVSSIAARTSVEDPRAFSRAIGSPATLRMGPWLMICELNHAIEHGASAALEDEFANTLTMMLGVDVEHRQQIVAQSRRMMNDAKLPQNLVDPPETER